MSILIRLLRWVGMKSVIIVLVVAVLTCTAFLVNWVRYNRVSQAAWVAIRAQENEFTAKVETAKSLTKIAEGKLFEIYQQKPNIWLHPFEHMQWKWDCKIVELSFIQAKSVELIWQNKLNEVKKILEMVDKPDDVYKRLIAAFSQTKCQILFVVVLALFGPTAWKVFWYFGLAPLAERSRPVRLIRDCSPDTSAIRIGMSEKACRVPLVPGEKLIVRMEWVQQYPPTARKRTRFLWKWKAPLISSVSGLIEMTEWMTTKNDSSDNLILASGLDPDKFVTRIDIESHPGLAIHPNCVVAITESINVTTQWNFRSLHSWISGRLRHILFCGTGSIYLCGYGGIRSVSPGVNYRIEEALVLGFERQLEFATARTETFWPYYRGKTSLFDYKFNGVHNVIAQHALPVSLRESSNPFIRAVDTILNGIGKLIGF